jgi:hypothetical protein
MSLQDIITRRLLKALIKIGEPEFDIEPGTALGGVPPEGLGFTSNSLRQILDELNGNQIGFGDLLERRLIQDEVKVSTKVSDLTEAILNKSMVKRDTEYEMKISERVRLGLRKVIADLASIAEHEVVPTENLAKYVTPTQVNVDRIRQAMTEMLDKYLFSPISQGDIQGTIGRIQRRLVNRMML